MYLPFPRKVNRAIGLALITIGFFLSTPPGFISPDDFLNVALAGFLTANFGLAPTFALFMTYTVIAWSLIVLGAMVYPYNTTRLLVSIVKKVQRLIIKCFTNPIYFIGLVVGLIFMYYVMYNYYMVIVSAVRI